MRIKLVLSLLAAGVISMSAQTQGYKDGIEYYKAGQYDNAKEILERTYNDNATDKSLANYYLGQVALQNGDKQLAKSLFDKGIAANADNAYNYVGLGALDLMNGNVSAAESNFKDAQKLAKKDAEVTINIARAYYNADPVKYAKEIQKYIDKARKDSKNLAPSIYILEGDMLAAQKDFGTAAARYENAIRNDANNPEGYVKYADAYSYVNPQFATQRLEEYLASHPESAMVQRELAELYFKNNFWRKASDLYGTYIQNPNHFPEDKARYAVLLYWGEKYPESLQIAREILANDPNNFVMNRVSVLNNAKLQNYPAALESAKKFFAIPGGNFNTLDYTTYAEVLSATGQDSLAVVQYELAAKNDPENGDLLKNLSQFYNQHKMYAKGADAYAAYLDMQENPTPDDLYQMGTRYLQAAGAATDSIEAKELAGRGKVYIVKLLENPNIKPIPGFYQRLAFLEIAGNDKKPNAEAVEALDKMIELLDQDPANKDPKNPSNQLALYKNAYAFKQAYYSIVKDADQHAKAVEDYNIINDLMTNGE